MSENARIGFGGNYLNPNWDEAGRVHDWRNYISAELRGMWNTFTPEQKKAIAESAEETASREDWE
jgi:hypothetical protein